MIICCSSIDVCFFDTCRLGGARAINRRYISDHVPVKQLTSASAAFVSASALGMAVGPALAGLLDKFNFEVLKTHIYSHCHNFLTSRFIYQQCFSHAFNHMKLQR